MEKKDKNKKPKKITSILKPPQQTKALSGFMQNLNNNSKELKLTTKNINKHFNICINSDYYYNYNYRKDAIKKVNNWLEEQKEIKKWFDYESPKQWEEVLHDFSKAYIALYPIFDFNHNK